MSGVEVAGLVLGVAGLLGLVPAFKEGFQLARAYREQRRSRLLSFITPSTEVLESETQNGETTVARQYHGFYSAYGDAFKRGDGVARETLQGLIIQLQHGLIIQLQNAQGGKKIHDMSRVVSVTVTSRVGAIAALSELAQRLAIAMPIERYPPAQSNPTNSWNAIAQYIATNNKNALAQYNPTSNRNPVPYVPPSLARRGVPGPRPRLLEYPSTQSTASYYSAPQVIHAGNCKKVTKKSYKSCSGQILPIPKQTSGPTQRCDRCNTRLTVQALTRSAQYQQG